MNHEQHYNTDPTIVNWVDEWSFKKANTATYTHKIHRYPAMFIPQLVRKIILQYTQKGDTVLDIFNGSGSTMVECCLTGRNPIGIEINPLANLIAKVKTTKINKELLINELQNIEKSFFDESFKYDVLNFNNIDFWFEQDTKLFISKLLTTFKNPETNDFFKVCLSEMIRTVSVCKTNGFKMHRDIKKIGAKIPIHDFFKKFTKITNKNIQAIDMFTNFSQNVNKNQIHGSSTDLQNIPPNSVDLILTSPPYGDSQTTVAYGQFSRLSSQCFGFTLEGLDDIGQLDKKLLGGVKQSFDLYQDIINRSITIRNAYEFFQMKMAVSDKDERKKLENRLNDVLSFYLDLDKCLKNGAYYLKPNKHFILVTGSRIVKTYKLHIDLIIAELAEEYGLELTSIFYRNIESKRMPSKGSATNVSGIKNETINRESIIVLYKV
jgi:16S rRNA G966 N2-methylase RsmD